MLVTGETFPTTRLLTNEVEGTEIEGVEHLGQYVFEMTQVKVEMLRKGRKALPHEEAIVKHNEDEEIDGEGGRDKVEHEVDESELGNVT